MTVTITRPFADFVAAPLDGGIRQPNYEKMANTIRDDATITTGLVDNKVHAVSIADVAFDFAGALSVPEDAQLDVLVAAHDGLDINRGNSTHTFPFSGGPTPAEDSTIIGAGDLQRYETGDFAQDSTSTPKRLFFLADAATGLWLEVFDRNPTFISSDAESQTTNAAYQPKLDTNPTLLAGDYYVTWSVDWSGTSNGTHLSVNVEVDSVEVGLVDDMDAASANEFANWSSFKVVTLAAGVRNFSLDFRKESGAGSAIVKNARLAYTRIA